MHTYLYFSPSHDAHRNMATDEFFLSRLGPEDFLLLFYINKDAVIIGKNQNAWKECNLSAMEEDGVLLARRVSGGGAVFHDENNLNFSFVAGEKRYNLEAQKQLILDTVRSMGIPAEYTGRNDITVHGKKFSGNAFCRRGNVLLHHGTLLIRSDLSRLQKYLNVSPSKIQSKGIASVRARVCNLCEFDPSLTVEEVARYLRAVYARSYGQHTDFLFSDADNKALRELYEKHRSWNWRLGSAPKFDIQIENRFPWGNIELYLSLKNGKITKATVYSDALNTKIAEKTAACLLDTRFIPAELAAHMRSAELGPEGCDIAAFLESGAYLS